MSSRLEPKRWPVAPAAGIALVLASCTNAAAPGTDDFADAPSAMVSTETGALRIVVHSSPDTQPTRGINALRLVVTKAADGSPATGLSFDVVPWMPAMGHGSSVKPTLRAGGEPGVYTIDDVNLFMPGLWEIRATISGSSSDHATASFEIQ
jgi:hypothetical protein